MGEIDWVNVFSFFALLSLAATIIFGMQFAKYTESRFYKKAFLISGVIFAIMASADHFFDIVPSSEPEINSSAEVAQRDAEKVPVSASQPAPKVEQVAEKPKPEVKRPEKSMMSESKKAIEAVTKHYVTDSWIMEYSEWVNPDGTISTQGACEIDSDGRKRLYWLTFDATGQKVLRLKIDSDLIYSVNGR